MRAKELSVGDTVAIITPYANIAAVTITALRLGGVSVIDDDKYTYFVPYNSVIKKLRGKDMGVKVKVNNKVVVLFCDVGEGFGCVHGVFTDEEAAMTHAKRTGIVLDNFYTLKFPIKGQCTLKKTKKETISLMHNLIKSTYGNSYE